MSDSANGPSGARRFFVPAVSVLVIFVIGARARAVSAQPDELLAARSWADRVFAVAEKAPVAADLKVLYEDVADNITRGRSWRGTPYMLGQKLYTHGIAFNSNKHLLVHLGKPAERFTADVGLENNDDTRRGATIGQGSVTFHVLVNGKEVLATPVMKLKDGARRIDVPLNGAQEFEIRVGDGGDGRGWDQALWAEATVALRDGRRLRLQDLPWADAANDNPFGFSFLHGGTSSRRFMGKWIREVRQGQARDGSQLRDIIYRDPAGTLQLHVAAILYNDFPAVEWTVYLKNTGSADTPILEDIQAFDGILPLATSGSAKLHWAKGAVASFDDFAPQETMLTAKAPVRLVPGGGRSSSQVMPFFNIEGAGGGIIAAIGWSGQWAAEFKSAQRDQMSMKAGMERTHLILHPGEPIRTPRMLMLFYQGDRWRGQNLLRQFILAHHRPTRDGKRLVAPITCGNWGGTRAEVHLDNIQKIVQNKLPIEYYWIDAEWYGRPGGPGTWAANVGDWQFKKDLYPQGFKPLSSALRSSGRELMLWFEPERVVKGTPWHKAHAKWLIDIGRESCLFNLGNEQARKFLTDFISGKIDEFGLGCYRQDFNMDPLEFWQKNDPPDRQGISEIRHIEGLYAFWDDLLQRHPNLIIDNCASGGRRLDLETLGRATPFWRTDGPRDAIAHQCHTYGLLPWVPLSATSQDRAEDDYEFRSSMCSGLCLNWWVAGDAPAERIPANFPFAWAKHTLDQYLSLRQYYYGDYYPLIGYSQAKDLWMAYQLHRPDLGRGMVVALRRPQSPYESARFLLQGLDEGAMYQIADLDSGRNSLCSGRQLMNEGLQVRVESQPGSALLTYERK